MPRAGIAQALDGSPWPSRQHRHTFEADKRETKSSIGAGRLTSLVLVLDQRMTQKIQVLYPTGSLVNITRVLSTVSAALSCHNLGVFEPLIPIKKIPPKQIDCYAHQLKAPCVSFFMQTSKQSVCAFLEWSTSSPRHLPRDIQENSRKIQGKFDKAVTTGRNGLKKWVPHQNIVI